MGSALRRTLIRTIRLLVTNRLAALGLGAVVLIGIASLVLFGVIGRGDAGGPGFNLALPTPGEPSATGEFLRGNRDYNAEMVWRSLSPEVQQEISVGGGSREAMQQQMDLARDQGRQLEEISYVGGRDLPNGTSMQFYLVGVRQQTGAEVEYVPFLFTLDPGGKIAKVQ